MEVQKELNHDTLQNILKTGKRSDQRGKLDYRPIEIEKEVLKNSEGSAIARIGKTQVIAGVKVDLAKPFPDRPNEGIFSTGAEFTPLGSKFFEPGPPRVEAIELARVVDRGIRSSEGININKYTVDGTDDVLAVYVDLWVVDHDGNLFDTAALAAMTALKNCRMPKIEDGKIIRNESIGLLEVNKTVASCTFAKLGEHHIIDPNISEELGADGLMIIAATDEHICSSQKSGFSSFTQKDIMELMDITIDKTKELRKLIDG